MKIRTGFVSNSSSSSFCIYGSVVNVKELKKSLNIMNKKYCDIEDEMPEGLEAHFTPYNDDECNVGRSWSSIKDDETGLQFKQRVEADLRTLLKKAVKCQTLERAWYDG